MKNVQWKPNAELINFGMTESEMQWLFSEKLEKYEFTPCLFKLLPYFGKVTTLRCKYANDDNHPDLIERRIMQIFMRDNVHKDVPFLPSLAYHLTCPVYSPALSVIGLRHFGTHVHPDCSVLFLPWYDGISVKRWLKTNPGAEKVKEMLFHVLWTLSFLQEKYKLAHNDLHNNNIMMIKQDDTRKNTPSTYQLRDQKFRLPGFEYKTLIIDYEMSDIYQPTCDDDIMPLNPIGKNGRYPLPNEFIEHNDLHRFLISLLSHTPLPQEIIDWIFDIYPIELIPQDLRRRRQLRPSHALSHTLKKVLEDATVDVAVKQMIERSHPDLLKIDSTDMETSASESESDSSDDELSVTTTTTTLYSTDDDSDSDSGKSKSTCSSSSSGESISNNSEDSSTNKKSDEFEKKDNNCNICAGCDKFYTPESTYNDYFESDTPRAKLFLSDTAKDISGDCNESDKDSVYITEFLYDGYAIPDCFSKFDIKSPLQLLLTSKLFDSFRLEKNEMLKIKEVDHTIT